MSPFIRDSSFQPSPMGEDAGPTSYVVSRMGDGTWEAIARHMSDPLFGGHTAGKRALGRTPLEALGELLTADADTAKPLPMADDDEGPFSLVGESSSKPVESNIEVEREDDGRWIAAVPSVPGAVAYGGTREEAITKAEAIAVQTLREAGRA